MTANTLKFLCSTLSRFQHVGIQLWAFGGWAEELWQMAPPRPHNDIDLLYPAASFDMLDRVIAAESAFIEIPLKRFSHKRAVTYAGVMLEFFLVHGTAPAFVTSFFDGCYQFHWPAGTFEHTIHTDHQTIAVASRPALVRYRQYHAAIEHAYTTWLQKHGA
jgi:hypothetical protein